MSPQIYANRKKVLRLCVSMFFSSKCRLDFTRGMLMMLTKQSLDFVPNLRSGLDRAGPRAPTAQEVGPRQRRKSGPDHEGSRAPTAQEVGPRPRRNRPRRNPGCVASLERASHATGANLVVWHLRDKFASKTSSAVRYFACDT